MPYFAIAVVIVLMVINGVFALSEMAVVSSRKVRLEGLAKGTDAGARAALDLVADPGRFLSTVQIGITLVGIVAGAYSGATIAEPLGVQLDRLSWIAPHGVQIASVLIVVAVTYLSLVIGELVPKRIALANPERVASTIARPMIMLSRIAAPAVWLLRASTDVLLRLIGLSATQRASITEDEVKALIAEGTRVGTFVPEERAMIEGVLRLTDRTVRVIMTQRSEIAWIDKSASREALVEMVEASPHTAFLVCDGSIDKAVGLVGARELLRAVLGGEAFDIGDLVRPTLFVADRTPVLTLIDLFRDHGVKIAVVVDEYGRQKAWSPQRTSSRGSPARCLTATIVRRRARSNGRTAPGSSMVCCRSTSSKMSAVSRACAMRAISRRWPVTLSTNSVVCRVRATASSVAMSCLKSSTWTGGGSINFW